MRLAWAVVALLAVGAGQAMGQQTGGKTGGEFSELARAPLRVGGPFLTITEDRQGEPVVVVDYPWTMHTRGSIEVCSLPADPAKRSEVRPLYFFNNSFHGEAMVAVYECQDASAKVPTRAAFSAEGTRFEVLGNRNALGRPAVCIAGRTQVEKITDVVDRVFFCLLAPWSVDRRTLQLELPRAYFPKPGKIRLWFLRGDVVVWSEDADWPGYPE